MSVGYPSLSSEFPNDNADVSGGAVWVCEALTGPVTVQLPAPPPLPPLEPVAAEAFVLCFEDDDPYVEGPLELQLTEHGPIVVVQHQAATAEAPPAFRHFERTLVEALMARSASRSAALVPKLLRLEPLPAEGLSKDVQLALQTRGYLEENCRYSGKFRDLWGAWSAVLQGGSQDLSACGTTTLDRFGADLLAALLAVPATRAEELRRDLRKAGIAAFGVLEAAA